MSLFDWITIVLVCSIGAIIPGPSLIIILYIANSKNLFLGIIASVGHGVGIFIYAIISIFSLSYIIEIIPAAYQTIQLIGALFILYIGYRIIFLKSSNKTKINLKKKRISILENFILGLTTSLINPKVIIFFTSIFSQFLNNDYSLFTKISMALIAGVIDATWYILVSYSINLNKVRNFININKHYIFFILGIVLIFFSIYLAINSVVFLITN